MNEPIATNDEQATMNHTTNHALAMNENEGGSGDADAALALANAVEEKEEKPSPREELPREEHVTRTSTPVVIGPFGHTSFQFSWNRAVDLVEFQAAPGFEVTAVMIGATACEHKTWEGRRVDRGTTVTVFLHNTKDVSGPCAGMWFTRDTYPAAEKHVPAPKPVPATPPIVNVGAPKGAAPSPTRNVEGPPAASYAHPAQPAPPIVPAIPIPGGVQMEGNVIIPQAGPPPPQMAPGSQFVQLVSGPPGVTGGDAVQPAQAPTHQMQGVSTTVGVGGQVIQHMGQHTAASPQAAGPDDVVVLLSRERCSKISKALRGAIIMPQEQASVVYPIQQALDTNQRNVQPGMNEYAIVLSRAHAHRILAVITGTDWREMEGLIHKFEACVQ